MAGGEFSHTEKGDAMKNPVAKPATDKPRAALAAAADELRATLAEIAAQSKQAQADAKTCERLESEIAELKISADVCDTASLQVLRSKQDALQLRRERATQRETEPSPLDAKLRQQLEALAPAIRNVSRPALDVFVAEFVAQNGRYLAHDSFAADLAQTTLSHLLLSNVVGCLWRDGVFRDPAGAAERALLDADRLLSGKAFWLRA